MVGGYEKALRRLWTGRCGVFVRKTKVNPDNGRNEPYEETLFSNEPCRLSFSSAPGLPETHDAAGIQQAVKLFLASGLSVPAGSKITVTQAGETKSYARSGEPAFYSTHQEITLAPFERWA
nr:MAG TPA: head closure knob [Caudoviricetes sp.]